MIEGDWGEAPRLDCVAGIEWLFEQGYQLLINYLLWAVVMEDI